MLDDKALAKALQDFATERDWDQFHTPKNLASALSVEAAELLEIFQWTRGQNDWSDLEDPAIRSRVEEEVADVLLYLIRFADKAQIDLQQVAGGKIEKNAVKYPVDLAKGSDLKYNEHNE